MFTTPTLSIAEASMTVVGVGVLKSLVRLMREPVTVISSRVAGAPPPAGVSSAGFCCAWAVAPNPITNVAAHRLRVSCLGSFVSNLPDVAITARTADRILSRVTLILGPLPRERMTRSQCGLMNDRKMGDRKMPITGVSHGYWRGDCESGGACAAQVRERVFPGAAACGGFV